jgi:hypothetical protein
MNGRSQGALRSLERRCPRDLNRVLAHERVGWMVACWIDKALRKIFFTPHMTHEPGALLKEK